MRYTTKTVCKESKEENVGKRVFCSQRIAAVKNRRSMQERRGIDAGPETGLPR